ncbi:ricin-type beta-trefoil lectin domain protein [Catenulispora yoronensis]
MQGGCLDINANATTSGTKVQLWTCNGGGNQQWTPGANGSLVNPQSGLCLDDPGSSTSTGIQLQIWSCNGTNAQRWTLP